MSDEKWVAAFELVLTLAGVAVGWFFWLRPAMSRSRVAANGTLGRARVLSLREDIIGSARLGTRRYSIVYEVHVEGQAPFRELGTETMDGNERRANPLEEGAWVQVRCDASRKVVVLERVPTETLAAQVDRQRAEAIAKERALLDDRTPR